MISSAVVVESSNHICGICSSGTSSKSIMSTSCDQKMKDGVCENISCTISSIEAVSSGIHNMSIYNNNSSIGAADSISRCANCGKEGEDVNNTCNKCKSKMVLYCNAACKKKHRHKHKKDCEEYIRRMDEHAAKLHDDKLFKQPPSQFGDCPICFLRLPTLETGFVYYSCCGKEICSGCLHAVTKIDKGKKCPFCRSPHPTSNEESIETDKKRMEAGDAHAIYNVGCDYRDGADGFPQDHTKALELWHRAVELGYTRAYCCIGYAYNNGEGVERDKKKAVHYYELAAMGGNVTARFNLGLKEKDAGIIDRAIKHFMIAVRCGDNDSLMDIQELYTKGHATKDDYTKALKLYQEYLGEVKSKLRDEAAAFDNEKYRYY